MKDADLLSRIDDRLRRLETRFKQPGTDTGGGTDAWYEALDSENWISGASEPVFAQAVSSFSNASDPDDPYDGHAQSGGFTLLDDHTLQLPPGVFTVDFVFTVLFNLNDSSAAGLVADDFAHAHWMLWQGGVLYRPDGVFTDDGPSNNLMMLDSYMLLDLGGGHAALRTGHSGGDYLWRVRQTVRAVPPDNLNLVLGIRSFDVFFGGHVPDFSSTRSDIIFTSPISVGGASWVRIHGSGAAES